MKDPFKDGWTMAEMEDAIQRNNPAELLYVPVWISMDPPDCDWAENICIKLSSHEHFNVRSNAILGLGHLARTCRKLNIERAKSVLLAALNDDNEYVRSQASDAIDDVENYLSHKI